MKTGYIAVLLLLSATTAAYADWCSPCIAMEEGTYPDPGVISELADFVAIKVDTQKRIDIESKYGIAYYPTVVFLDAEGREVSRHIGYLGPEDMVEEIKKSRGMLPKESPGVEALLIISAFICGSVFLIPHSNQQNFFP